MSSILLRALAPAILALAVTPAAFATTAVSGTVALDGYVAVTGGDSNSSSASQSWSTTPTHLATGLDLGAGAGNQVHGKVEAAWSSADAGSVTFANYGWELPEPGSARLTGADDWSYTFVADANGTFTLDYTVVGHGDTFGLWGWGITMTGQSPRPVSNPADPTTSGTYTGALVAGETYTVALTNNANLSGGFASGSMDGEFDWSIASTPAVPEPANAALLVAGLALAGAVARRRQR